MLASQLLWQLVGEFVKQEFASGELEVLLVHTVSTFEASHNHSWWSLQQSEIWIKLSGQLAAHLGSAVVTE